MVKVKCARLFSLCHENLLNIEKLEDLEVLFLQSTSNDSLSKMNTIHFPVFLKTLIVRCEAEYFKISKRTSQAFRTELFHKALHDRLSKFKLPFGCDIIIGLPFYINNTSYFIFHDSRAEEDILEMAIMTENEYYVDVVYDMIKEDYPVYERFNNTMGYDEQFMQLCNFVERSKNKYR